MLALFAGLLLAACGSSGGSASRVKSATTAAHGSNLTVCLDVATSGPFSVLGTYNVIGAQAYFASLNKKGGVLGHPVRLVVENDNSDPATAASLIRKCVLQDHAQFILGPEESSTAAAAIPVANSLRVPLLGFQSGWNSLGLPAADLHSYSFPVISNAFDASVQSMLHGVIIPNHYTRVAAMEDNVPGGLGTSSYFASAAKPYGVSLVAHAVLQPGATNDTPAVVNLLAAKPQLILLSGVVPGPDVLTALKAIRTQDPTIPIGMCLNCAVPSFISAAGPSTLKNVYLLGTPGEIIAANTSGSGGAVSHAVVTAENAYIKGMTADGHGGATDINSAASQGWDGGAELTNAIVKAGSISASAVKLALQHQQLVVGGFFAYTINRTPFDYSVRTTTLAISTISASGQLKLVRVTQVHTGR